MEYDKITFKRVVPYGAFLLRFYTCVTEVSVSAEWKMQRSEWYDFITDEMV